MFITWVTDSTLSFQPSPVWKSFKIDKAVVRRLFPILLFLSSIRAAEKLFGSRIKLTPLFFINKNQKPWLSFLASLQVYISVQSQKFNVKSNMRLVWLCRRRVRRCHSWRHRRHCLRTSLDTLVLVCFLLQFRTRDHDPDGLDLPSAESLNVFY